MNRIARWKIFVVLAICLLGGLFAAPNLMTRDQIAKLPSFMSHARLNLGLDLQGGLHLLYEVNLQAVTNERMEDLANLTFETNGTQRLQTRFAAYLTDWEHMDREITFSVSPKLSASGESWSDAIVPDVVSEYEDYGTVYLKFVVDSEAHFAEVDQAVSEYRASGFTGKVYVLSLIHI